MPSKSALAALLLPLHAAAETVVGVYVFSRHGDRTSKSTPPTNLTDLGYSEVFGSGSWFRDQYVATGAAKQIAGISADLVALTQVGVSAPLDNVLMSSAVGFTQGLYPPAGAGVATQQLANSSSVSAPLGGYQIVPIQQTTSGTGSESSAWLQGASNCANAIVSSNAYFFSDEYSALLASTQGFYDGLRPMVNSTFSAEDTNFKNAYTLFDYLNVAHIHNASFPGQDLLTNDTFFQLRTLADNHEFNLAYNASAPIRAIAGSTLAAQVVQALNATVAAQGKSSKLTVQFGAYGSFQSYFGLAGLTALGPDWTGVPDYASSMTWELFTNGSADPFPAADQLNVRFFFHNGTTSNDSTPVAYPLFGQQSTVIAWNDFVAATGEFAIGDQASWCSACGNTTGVCAGAAAAAAGGSGSSQGASDGGASAGGISPAVGGVIGAMVTLAVILGLEAIILLAGGLRVVSKKRVAGPAAPEAAKAS